MHNLKLFFCSPAHLMRLQLYYTKLEYICSNGVNFIIQSENNYRLFTVGNEIPHQCIEGTPIEQQRISGRSNTA